MRSSEAPARYEIKFYIRPEMVSKIREYASAYLVPDPHARKSGNNSYTVRSIYFDSTDLEFYYDRQDGLKIRKKLRIRTYNTSNDDLLFLEIKRRFSNVIVKERARLSYRKIQEMMVEPAHQEWFHESRDRQVVLGKFCYNLLQKSLRSTILIVYDREPYIDKDNNTIRLTIDSNIRIQNFPVLDDIFKDENLFPLSIPNPILELKFNDIMPKWMRSMVFDYELLSHSISKYCMGIEQTFFPTAAVKD